MPKRKLATGTGPDRRVRGSGAWGLLTAGKVPQDDDRGEPSPRVARRGPSRPSGRAPRPAACTPSGAPHPTQLPVLPLLPGGAPHPSSPLRLQQGEASPIAVVSPEGMERRDCGSWKENHPAIAG